MLKLSAGTTGNRSQILGRILSLRLIALLVALCVLLVFQFYLHRSLSYPMLYGVTLVAIVYSFFTWLRSRSVTPVTDVELFSHLVVDAGILIVLVALSGRATNPFIYYLLVLVAINATIFSPVISWAFAALAIIAYSLLLYFDLGAHSHHLFSDFQLHLVGMWVNFVGSTVLINYFVSTLAAALRDRELRLSKAREQTLKNEQLIGIGTLAASTVHALGTPLSTMAIAIGEMKTEAAADTANLDLLLAQVERCKQTMGKLSMLAESQEDDRRTTTASDLFEDVKEHYLLLNPTVMPEIELATDTENVRLSDSVLLLYALINLIDNAIRAASTSVRVQVKQKNASLQISIIDDGEGVPTEVLDNFGKPGISRMGGGLGIGVFLANTTVEKLNGSIILFNPHESRNGKTTVIVELPLVQANE